jgi:biopolymer transport protein ExbD/biopolymer transport protein TolR
MGAALFSGTKRKLPEPDMNVTPLVDVTLVLLIIFMVVAPAINEGENLALPYVSKPDEKPKDMNPIEVTMTASNGFIVEKERLPGEQLKARLTELHKADPERKLMLKTDSTIPYSEVRGKFGMLQEIGFRGVSLKVMERKKPGEG